MTFKAAFSLPIRDEKCSKHGVSKSLFQELFEKTICLVAIIKPTVLSKICLSLYFSWEYN